MNHNTQARNSHLGKRLLSMIVMPERMAGETDDHYRMLCNRVFQEHWRFLLRLVNKHRFGFMMCLPGANCVSHIVPRIGLYCGDIKEQRLVTGTTGTRSVRCGTVIQARPPKSPNSTAFPVDPGTDEPECGPSGEESLAL